MKKVLIVGLGLLGGSYAKGLTAKGYHVTAIDPNKDSIQYGLDAHIIQEGATSVEKALVSSAELIVFCLYPHLMLDWVKNYQDWFQDQAVITDVCGIKSDIVEGMTQILDKRLHFVGSHPMAGKEVSGVLHSDPSMFKKANFILTPTADTTSYAIETVETMAKDLEFKQISHLSPLEHDKAIAFLSQLTHVIAVSLMNCQESDDYVKYTGDSFRDLTRIAMINEHLWSQLFLSNKSLLLDEITRFSQELEDFKELLAEDDVEGMKDKFIQSTQRRKKYIPKPPNNTK